MEKKESTKSESCWWCSKDSSLNVAPGWFRDFDSDLSYGIPVCGGCGGLGIQFDSDDFKERTDKIMKLRFEYCPQDPEKMAALTIPQKLNILKSIEQEVIDLVKTYGYGAENSLARQISEGALRPLIEHLEGISTTLQ